MDKLMLLSFVQVQGQYCSNVLNKCSYSTMIICSNCLFWWKLVFITYFRQILKRISSSAKNNCEQLIKKNCMFYSVIDHHHTKHHQYVNNLPPFKTIGWSTDATFTQIFNVLQLAVLQTFTMLYLKVLSKTMFRKNSENMTKPHGLMAQ